MEGVWLAEAEHFPTMEYCQIIFSLLRSCGYSKVFVLQLVVLPKASLDPVLVDAATAVGLLFLSKVVGFIGIQCAKVNNIIEYNIGPSAGSTLCSKR